MFNARLGAAFRIFSEAKKLPSLLPEVDNAAMIKTNLFMLMVISLLCMVFAAWPHVAWSALQQSHAEIRAAIGSFVRAQLSDLPGKITIKTGGIDRRLALAACPVLEPFVPSGGRLLGNTTIGVRCVSGSSWTLFVPVQIKVSADLLVAVRPLQQGQVLRTEDIAVQNGDLTHPGVLVDPAQAVGKVLKFGIGAGQALKQDMLRLPYAITEGQKVQIQVAGKGYRINYEGQALNNATEGQNLRIRTASGQVINGLALADGSVEVHP